MICLIWLKSKQFFSSSLIIRSLKIHLFSDNFLECFKKPFVVLWYERTECQWHAILKVIMPTFRAGSFWSSSLWFVFSCGRLLLRRFCSCDLLVVLLGQWTLSSAKFPFNGWNRVAWWLLCGKAALKFDLIIEEGIHWLYPKHTTSSGWILILWQPIGKELTWLVWIWLYINWLIPVVFFSHQSWESM